MLNLVDCLVQWGYKNFVPDPGNVRINLFHFPDFIFIQKRKYCTRRGIKPLFCFHDAKLIIFANH